MAEHDVTLTSLTVDLSALKCVEQKYTYYNPVSHEFLSLDVQLKIHKNQSSGKITKSKGKISEN